MGDEQRVSWQELLAQSRDDFEGRHCSSSERDKIE
jgi:hypothetical protein